MAVVNVSDVKYARSGDLAIAYQAVGDGSRHVVFLPMFSNLALQWLDPRWAQFFERIQSFSRLIMFDKRGTGLSDRPREFGTLETRMDDIRAVLDALGVERTALLGSYEGGQTCALFAATYPERTEALVLFNTPARAVQCADYGYGATPDEWRTQLEAVRKRWGERDFLEEHARRLNPSCVGDPDYVDWYVTWMRACASPGTALSFFRMFGQTDIREVLPSVRVPTLVLYRAFAQAEMLDVADRIPDAQAIRLPGEDYGIFVGDELTTEVERFLTGGRREVVPDRVLTTVLFTDIVASTDRTAALGDSMWRDLLTRHHAAVRRELARFGGQEVDTAGDGFFATFDGPARAIRCAQAIVNNVSELGLKIRAGIHTGECEVAAGKVAGLAVIIGARVADIADAGEVFVSSTVTDLVAGSGIEFKDRGVHTLKGVPGERRLFAVLQAADIATTRGPAVAVFAEHNSGGRDQIPLAQTGLNVVGQARQDPAATSASAPGATAAANSGYVTTRTQALIHGLHSCRGSASRADVERTPAVVRYAFGQQDALRRATADLVPVGAGVHTGVAYVRAVGSDSTVADFTALGDAVNVTARGWGRSRARVRR